MQNNENQKFKLIYDRCKEYNKGSNGESFVSSARGDSAIVSKQNKSKKTLKAQFETLIKSSMVIPYSFMRS